MKKSAIGIFASLLLPCAALGAEAPRLDAGVNTPRSSLAPRDVGRDSFAELDAQGGYFSGLRLKGIIYPGRTHHLAIEGMWGGSQFANSAGFPTTWGGGVREELYISSNRKNRAWMLSPGFDAYYVPAAPSANASSGVPTRVVLISPNFDISWLHEFSPHFCFVAGARFGAAFAVNGTNVAGQNLAGKFNPDLGLFAGTRF